MLGALKIPSSVGRIGNVEEHGGKISELSFYEATPEYADELFAAGSTMQQKAINSVVQETDKELVNGFLPIKELIYDTQRLKLYEIYMSCNKN